MDRRSGLPADPTTLDVAVDAVERTVRRDPVAAYRSANKLMAAEDLGLDQQWRVERARGEAARWAASIDTSIQFLRDSVETARQAASDEAVVACTITLAGSVAIGGDLTAAERLLRGVEPIAHAAQHGQLLFQLGTIRARAGHHRDAIELLDRSQREFEASGDDLLIASVLGNLGMALLSSGELLRARATLERARDAYSALELTANIGWVTHNLGRVEDYLGNVPVALARYDEAAALLRTTTATPWEVEVSRCATLADAGLYDDASALAVALSDRLEDVGMSLDAAEAMLIAARCVFAAGQRERAIKLARQLVGRFEQQGRRPWADLARLVELEAEVGGGDVDTDELARLAERVQGRLARTKASLLLALQDSSKPVPDVRSDDPLELQLLAAEVEAVRLDRAHQPVDALRRLSGALRLAGRRRVMLGSADMRSAFGVHTARLASIGRTIAERHLSGAIELDWLERGRALSLLDAEDVASRTDEDLGQLVGHLRIITAQLNTCAVGAESGLRAERVNLEARIRDHQRRQRGVHASPQLPRNVARRTRKMMGGGLAVSLFGTGEHLDAIVVGPRCTIRRRLSSENAARVAANRVRAAGAALANGHGDGAEARRSVDELDQLVFGQLNLDMVPGTALVISPPPWMVALPWLAFPSLAGHPVTLSPSLTHLSVPRDRRRVSSRLDGQTVIVNGPRLRFGATETRRIANRHPDAQRLTGREATSTAVIDSAGLARCLHIAAHGRFNAANPLFSSLELHEGSLSVNDVIRHQLAPDVVVLTSCDAALGSERAGDELLGFPTAFLANGSHAVIAGVGLLPDTAITARTAAELHDRLAVGTAPDIALREAVEMVAADPRTDEFLARCGLVCIGRPARPS